MIDDLLFGLGLVAVFEGLVLALAPLRFEEILAWMARLDIGTRRMLGLGFVAFGVALVWIARGMLG